MTSQTRSIGLIAGQGVLPILVAQGIRQAGHRVSCVGLRGQYHQELPQYCDEFAVAGIVRLGRWIRLMRRWRLHEAVMVGRVGKERMHDPFRVLRQIPDWRAFCLWYRALRHDRRTPALLTAVAEELYKSGITLMDSTKYIPEHMATSGIIGQHSLSNQQQLDLDLGWPLLEQIVELDIGQCLTIRDSDVIAVEAVEGTDAVIDRTALLCKSKGWTLMKSTKPSHDMRADVPSIGPQTVERVAAAGGRCIAMGVGRVILLDRPVVIETADRLGVTLVGLPIAANVK